VLTDSKQYPGPPSEDLSKIARDTLEDVFAKVDVSIARAHASQTVPPQAQDAHTALIGELSSALDEARGRLRKAEVELRTYSQTRAGAPGEEAQALMADQVAKLTSRAEVAEAQARRAEEVSRQLQEEVNAFRASATAETLATVRADTAGEEAAAEARAAVSKNSDDEVVTLRKRLSEEQAKVSKLQSEISVTRVELSNAKTAPPATESQARVVAMQQEIATLNQQMAHLFTELTFARTELAQRQEQGGGSSQELAQVPELLQDMRHLQLDLEYHQQKLDQVLEENGQLREEVQKRKEEATVLVEKAEEATQRMQHLEIDLARSRAGPGAAPADKGADLRKELKAKEGLLTTSHYELHKEKLARQRAEQRAGKLRDRLEKLMEVVEQQRDAVRELEARALDAETRAYDGSAKLRVASNQVSRLTHLLGTSGKQPAVPERSKGA